MKIWPCGSSPRSGYRNAWTRIKSVNGASRLSKFGIFSVRSKWFHVVFVDHGRNMVISLWPGDIATINRVAAKWITPPQKIPSAKIRWKIPRHYFSGMKTSYSSFIIFQSVKLSTRNITHLCWCNWRTFWRKTPRESHQGVLVLARQHSGSPVICNPEVTALPGLPVSLSPIIFSGSGPVGLLPAPWTEKTIEKSPFFVRRGGHCCRGDMVGRTIFWIFWGLFAKVRPTG